MKSRFGTLALAAGPLLSVVLIGCNPPIDEKKADTAAPTVTTDAPKAETPAPATDAPKAETPAPAVTPAVESPKAETPAPATDAPKPAEETKPAPDPKA